MKINNLLIGVLIMLAIHYWQYELFTAVSIINFVLYIAPYIFLGLVLLAVGKWAWYTIFD